MTKKHALDDKAKQALKFLLSGTHSSINAAVIAALGGKDSTNEAQIKTLKRLFARKEYHKLFKAAQVSGSLTMEQAEIIDLRKRAAKSLEETEELYYELALLEGTADCAGAASLIEDLTGIVDKYTEYHLDTVELLSQALIASLSKLIRNSWKTGDTALDSFGNELLSPKLTITLVCDPSSPEPCTNLHVRGPGVISNGRDTTIRIEAATPIDEETKRKNIQDWVKANDERLQAEGA
ncbi:hypothetical protein [Rhizobium sp. MHM7A]|uniref:hypothetical protein n=1 Tax=Rhizobium sp. MHM7A TaxID=2583233 RepID=UPI0011067E35|nr:hypothetical protein [Rhizobium sp. MHM7A]TLX16035.1 hypothetical protein FFR93_01575 [Rhizobium sp. MHM7A]